ncbi:hypothetical protein F2P81_019775 [Scophthalmus maximus]|uniref:Protein DIS3 homolog n=1 Tax=Scophthalmus maximus TaxID=52904 RepID=A0A6A4S8S0_SCOMX|nr:hypothetical protein F2P81_019775 [Scophthalmus maximus]
MKIVREHYLRDDIWCGSEACSGCKQESTVLQTDACMESSLCSYPHYLVPDTNVVLHQIDVLEDPVIRNVIILQTVLQEVRHRSAPVYKRLKDVLHEKEKHFYTFTNEHHRETFIDREPGESANDRNDRAIRVAAKWYSQHLKTFECDKDGLKVVLLTNDQGNKQKAEESGLLVYKCEEYIKSLIANPELVDRLALSNDDKVLLQGLQNLNRAVHQDVVAVQLLPRSQWVAPSSVVLQDEGAAKDDDVEEEEEEKALRISAAEAARKPTGKVVGIIKRNWRPFCGMLNVSQIKESTRHLFTPADRRVPRIRIETRQASTLAGHRIMVAIDGWPKDSRYPNGHFVRSLGSAGEKDTEQEVLLLEHDVPHQAFSQAVLSFLPKMPWAITPEVGVHIADVSHFIRPSNALDKEAASRGTTVYLCGKRIDMVPELLSSNLCSLRSNVERALTLSSLEVRFHMDSETHDPIDLQTKELMETNSMVEEFMLLANISVAQKIYDEFSECALLRKHPAPPPSNYDILLKAAKSKDVEIHTDSAKALADSLDGAKVDGFPYFNTLLRILATRCMMQAVYFCSGMDSDFHHYGLASPIYTHFTSPIRRYADIIVHRLLAVAIGADSTYPDLMDKHKQSALCNNLNYRHKMSQYAQRASVAFHTQLFFKSRGILNEEGYVLFVRKNAIIVLIPKFGLEGTVFFDTKGKTVPNLVFDKEGPTLSVEQHIFCIFDKVKVTITLDDSNVQHQKIRMSLIEPVITGVSVPAPDAEPQAKKLKLDN